MKVRAIHKRATHSVVLAAPPRLKRGPFVAFRRIPDSLGLRRPKRDDRETLKLASRANLRARCSRSQ